MKPWWWLWLGVGGCLLLLDNGEESNDGSGSDTGSSTSATDGGGGGGGGGGGSGDDDDDLTGAVLTCDDEFVPCGGDPLGSWAVVDLCTVPVPGLDCEELVFSVVEDRSSGTMEVRKDGTFSRVTQFDVDAEITLPTTCIAPLPCSLIPPASGGVISACSQIADECICQATITESDSEDGTWVMDGTDFVANGDRWPICVQGNDAISLDSSGAQLHWER